MSVFEWKLRNLPHMLRGLPARVGNRIVNSAMPRAELHARVIRRDGRTEDLGLIGTRLVTTAAVNYIVDSFQNSTTSPISDFRYHGCGTGSVAEAVGDTTLGTQVGTRETGSQEEGASPNIYKSVATISFTASAAITEHGVFSAATAGTLLDRTVFAAINVANGDSIAFTYQLTVNAGG